MEIALHPASIPGARELALPRSLQLRELSSADAALVQTFVRELTPASRYRRFHGGLAELPERLLGQLTERTPGRRSALVLENRPPLWRLGTPVEPLALAHLAALEDGESLEFAIVVSDRWQSRGLGRWLIERLVERARESGYRFLVGEVLADNRPMLRLARSLGFSLAAHPGEPQLVRVRREFESHPAGRAARHRDCRSSLAAG